MSQRTKPVAREELVLKVVAALAAARTSALAGVPRKDVERMSLLIEAFGRIDPAEVREFAALGLLAAEQAEKTAHRADAIGKHAAYVLDQFPRLRIRNYLEGR